MEEQAPQRGIGRREAAAALAAAALSPWAAAPAHAQAASAPPAPAGARMAQLVQRFAQRPVVERLLLSPDGKRFAALANRGPQTVLVVREVAGGALKPLLASDNLERQIAWFRWVNDSRLVFGLRAFGEVRMRTGWAETIETRLFGVDVDGGNLRNLVRDRFDDGITRNVNIQDRVVDWLPGDGRHILLALRPSRERIETAVYKVDVDSGRRTMVQEPRDGVVDWFTDAGHRARIAVEVPKSGPTVYWCNDPDGSRWRRLPDFGALRAAQLRPLGFGLDPQRLYVSALHQGLQAVWRVDLTRPEAGAELVLASRFHDLHGSLVHDPRGEAVGISVTALDATSRYYWGAAHRSLIAGIDKALPGRFNRLTQWLADDSTYLLRSSGNGIPAVHFIGSRATGKLSPVADEFPELEPDELPRKQTLTARDGVPLTSYLTRPRGAPNRPLPLMLLVHGGPHAADNLDFDPLVAFVAELGYAVLQVNFRGSAGYGAAFLERGYRRWGLEMQDDLEDAVLALVKDGTADARRLAVAGGSYGGYAALMAAVKTPALFRGAFAIAPVTDLLDLVEEAELGHFIGLSAHVAERIGTSKDDRERLLATSPRHRAAAVEGPVVLVHGSEDRVVPYRHSEWMEDALRKAGKPVKLVRLDKGDHALSHVPHRERMFGELAQFLRDTVGPGAGG